MAVRVPRELSVRDPKIVAPLAGLTYVVAESPGWGRRRCGRGFSYIDECGRIIRGPERERLSNLAVPPAWEDVWLAPVADGYLQATGTDAAGRRQYRYHDDYRAVRDARKFERLRYFARAIPGLRARIDEMTRSKPGSRAMAIGAVLGVIDHALLRVGNERSSSLGHYGATTLETDHLDEDGHTTLEYVAKGGKKRLVVIEDEHLGDILHSLADVNDGRLFSYQIDGKQRTVTASDVNAVIAQVAGPAFSAKDFRTWGGSRDALEARVEGAGATETVDAAARALGNSRAVARDAYIHPAVLSSDDATIADVWRRSRTTPTMSRGDRALAKLLSP